MTRPHGGRFRRFGRRIAEVIMEFVAELAEGLIR
ncbi:hypothetical protein ABIE52_000449 [Rhodococcus sp. OAS809]|jgi:hypothetical protein|nr:hypothetical protein B0E55_05999 [Rhodococcus sp. 66b]